MGPPEDLQSLGLEFKHNEAFQRKVRWLEKNGYTGWRRILGDGNCFYRAVGFALMEQLVEPSMSSTTSAHDAERQRAARAHVFYNRLSPLKLDPRLLSGSSAVNYPPEQAHQALLSRLAPLCECGGRWNPDAPTHSAAVSDEERRSLTDASELLRLIHDRSCVLDPSDVHGRLHRLYSGSTQVRAAIDRCCGWPLPAGSEARVFDELLREEAASVGDTSCLHLDLRLPASGRASDRAIPGGVVNLDLALVRALRQLSVDFIRSNRDDVRVGQGLSLSQICSAESSGYQGVDDFCDREVLSMGREAEGVVLNALAMALGESFRVVYLDRAEPQGASGVEVPVMDYHPLEDVGTQTPRIHVQFRPGHYDVIYPGVVTAADVAAAMVPGTMSMPASSSSIDVDMAAPTSPTHVTLEGLADVRLKHLY